MKRMLGMAAPVTKLHPVAPPKESVPEEIWAGLAEGSAEPQWSVVQGAFQRGRCTRLPQVARGNQMRGGRGAPDWTACCCATADLRWVQMRERRARRRMCALFVPRVGCC